MLEKIIVTGRICGCFVEIVDSLGQILLYADGYFVGELWEEENPQDYISQAEEILA